MTQCDRIYTSCHNMYDCFGWAAEGKEICEFIQTAFHHEGGLIGTRCEPGSMWPPTDLTHTKFLKIQSMVETPQPSRKMIIEIGLDDLKPFGPNRIPIPAQDDKRKSSEVAEKQ
jgi:hypothetical protein